MWDGLFTLLFLSIIMGGASFGAGIVPLSLQLSKRKLRLMTALGTGILVGTSLIVIIPEGIETLYKAEAQGHSHSGKISSIKRIPTQAQGGENLWSRDLIPSVLAHSPPVSIRRPDDQPGASNEPSHTDLSREPEHDSSEAPQSVPHGYVGLALISGFILMYLIDTLPQHATPSSQPARFQINLNHFSLNRSDRSDSVSSEAETASTRPPFNPNSPTRPSSTTIGLVIHAAADGIALGASSITTSRLTFVIFVALMIHKAPAAFGLTSVLLKQGVSKRAAKAHLILFSLAAPTGALVTWFAAHLLGYTSSTIGEDSRAEFGTGLLLLFSAGTFLYVAMHTMQENAHDSEDHAADSAGTNGYAGLPTHIYGEPTAPVTKDQKQLSDTLVTVCGMLLPLITQIGHAH